VLRRLRRCRLMLFTECLKNLWRPQWGPPLLAQQGAEGGCTPAPAGVASSLRWCWLLIILTRAAEPGGDQARDQEDEPEAGPAVVSAVEGTRQHRQAPSRKRLCGQAICFASAAYGDERVEMLQHPRDLHRRPLALPARCWDVLRIEPVGDGPQRGSAGRL
jgi:hypothetical protein